MNDARVGVFVFYDEDGIVDDYITYMLRDLIQFFTDFCIVCNGKICPESLTILEQFTDKIFVRENLGYDVMAYKLALTEYYGWDYLSQFDEVVLFNDTFFGPIGSFKAVFDKMSNSKADFWGISRYYGGSKNSKEYFTYIQYYFIAFRSKMVNSKLFQQYWNELDSTKWSYKDALRKHEWSFTKKMTDYGFAYDTYVKAKEFEFEEPELNIVQYFSVSYELIKEYHFPIIKKKAFAGKNFQYSPGEDIRRTLDYVEENKLYDTNLIWQHILRVYNIKDIYNSLHLDFVIPIKTSSQPPSSMVKRTAVLLYCREVVFMEETLSYIQALPAQMKVIVCIDTSDTNFDKFVSICSDYKSYQIIRMRGHLSLLEVYACLKILKEPIEYLCVIAPDMEKVRSNYERKLLRYLAFENTIATKSYIYNIITLFKSHLKLGFLSVPSPIHNDHYGTVGNEWQGYYGDINKIMNELKLNCKLSEDVSCFGKALGFWCRIEALQTLFDYAIKTNMVTEADNFLENQALNRIYPYVAQSQGYYSGVVMSDRFASYRLNTLEYTLSGILNQYRLKGTLSDFQSVITLDMIDFACVNEQNFIFGTGSHADEAMDIMTQYDLKFSGFVVSDDKIKENEKADYPVFSLSEIPIDSTKDGIIVAIHKRYLPKVLPELRDKGYRYIIW